MPRLKRRTRTVAAVVFFIIQFVFYSAGHGDYADLTIGNEEEPKSRLMLVDGNMYFYAGKNKNISFHVSPNAAIRFGDTNILELPNKVDSIRGDISRSMSKLDYYSKAAAIRQRTMIEFAKKLGEFHTSQTQLTGQVSAINKTLKSRGRISRKLKALILRLSDQIDRLLKLMYTNECVDEAPCQNGGTCIDLFGKYQCICPNHYEGNQCEKRVDECAIFAGTLAGCQNNSTCSNNNNTAGFVCHCASGFHGHLCQQKQTSCDYALDLCGEHGHCTPTGDGAGYKCLCEWGYRANDDAENPYCEDVNECLENPCFPGSSCLNLPGSFRCGECPVGSIGNGFHCVDFDECVNDLTNDCSKKPRVECINTHNSYKCGPCPAGFEGDGYRCIKLANCVADRNPCYPGAVCREQEYDEEFHCECPGGMVGDGVGPDGCQWSNKTLCNENSCNNGGTCNTVSDSSFVCQCPYGYFGNRCQHASVCIKHPDHCGVHGRCLFELGMSHCVCDPGYYGFTCNFQEKPCSFHTSNETGTIVFHHVTKDGNFISKDCSWHIELFDTRKIIRLYVENVTIPYIFDITSHSCSPSVANFSIFDGPTALSPPLMNFCYGEQTQSEPYLFYSSGNSVTMRLYSRIQSRETYIHVKWEAVQTRCGGRLVGLNGRIDYYQNGRDLQERKACVWFVQVPPQYHIQLTVESIKFASDQFVNCTMNSLEIYDSHFVINRSRISSLCETQTVPSADVRTSGNYAVVYYRFDPLSTPKCDKCRYGFSVRYTTIDLPEGCGGEIVPDADGHFEGVIQSPNYDQFYFPNLDCLWVLNATSVFESTEVDDSDLTIVEEARLAERRALQQDRRVAIEFADFDVVTTVTKYTSPSKQMTSCNGDYVEIPELDVVYCNHKPPTLLIPITNAPTLSIRFHSDDRNAGRGFMIKYKTVCQRTFHDTNGSISSPNYPEAAHHAFKCIYRIVAQPNQAIRVKFKHIGLHLEYLQCQNNHGPANSEEGDYIELSGGYSSYKAINKRYYCEFFPFVAPNGEIVTSGNRPFQITYSTSGTKLNTGFRFDYEIVDVGCGGVFTEEQRVITSPNYPETYLAHMYCIYHLSVLPEATKQKALRLTFDVFDVENVGAIGGDNCDFDSVRLYDWFVDEENHGELLGKFCGKSVPPPVLAPNERMVLVFSSDRSMSGAGFSARIAAVDLTIDCDRTFFALQATITFNASLFRFSHNVQCDYRIVMPSTHRILLTIHNFSSDCSKSTLMIRNGGSADSPGFPSLFRNSELCGVYSIRRFKSQGNRLFLRFRSQNSVNAFFNVSYELYDQGCGGHVRGLQGAIAAPQYPQQDSRTLSCEWQISVAAGSLVQLTFVDIDNLDANDYFGGCSVHTRNLISVLDGPPTAGGEVLRRYCRHDNSSTPIVSRLGNQMTVRYSQYGDSRHSAIYGFMAEFKTVCQDIVLNEPHGTIQSPGYPEAVYITEFLACNWRIVTNEGSRVQLIFHRFHLSAVDQTTSESMCHKGIFEMTPSTFEEADNIFEDYGRSHSIRWLANSSIPKHLIDFNGRLCGESVGTFQITAPSNSIQIKYLVYPPKDKLNSQPQDSSLNQFWLTWSTIGCGGSIYVNNSRMLVNASADFTPAAVSDVRRCSWKIVAPVGFLVRIKINQLYTADQPSADPSLQAEGVEFYSARSNISGAPIQTFRGALRNVNVTSLTNEFFVQFLTHASTLKRQYYEDFGRDGIIFDAQVDFVVAPNADKLGGTVIRLEVGKSVQIHSPNYPLAPPAGANAIWQFEAPPGYTVTYRIRNYINRNSWVRTANPTYCSLGQVLANGGITIFNGLYKRHTSTYRVQNVLTSICESIDNPRDISTMHNVSGVIFRVSRTEPVMKSGETSNITSPVGLLMDVKCECGGILYATSERQSIILTGQIANSPVCVWEIASGTAPPSRNTNGTRRRRPDNDDYSEEDNDESNDNSDDEQDRLVYVRIKVYFSPAEAEFEAFCGEVSLGNKIVPVLLRSDMTVSNYVEFSCESKMKLVARNLTEHGAYIVSYDTQRSFCGGLERPGHGEIMLIFDPSRWPRQVECEWQLDNLPGNRVDVMLMLSHFEDGNTDLCEESYVEFREYNASGPLLGRYCGVNVHKSFSKESIWIRLRYHFGDDPTDTKGRASVNIMYIKQYGGQTNSPIIKAPPMTYLSKEMAVQERTQWIIRAKPEQYLRIELIEYTALNYVMRYLLEHTGISSVQIYSDECATKTCIDADAATAINVRNEVADGLRVFIVRSDAATIIADRASLFQLRWEAIGRGDVLAIDQSSNGTTEASSTTDFYTCGGELKAEFTRKTFVSPRNTLGVYNNNERCRWTIRRQPYTSVSVNVTAIEMEEHVSCLYDFMAILKHQAFAQVARADDIPDNLRTCRRNQLTPSIDYKADDNVDVFMITDRSRPYAGFVIDYFLTCEAYEYVQVASGLLDIILTNPGYPNVYRAKELCSWALILESTRNVTIKSQDIDMEPRNAAGVCDLDYIEISNKPFSSAYDGRRESRKFCGNERIDVEQKLGGIFIRFVSSERTPHHRGFKLHLAEVVFDCSVSDLHVDEFMSARTLSSPQFPHLSPNSLDCTWTLSAPSGRRLKFTVDPVSFNLQTSSNGQCEDDYLEIRDGASEVSPLIGRYCGVQPPSSVVSTGSHLYVRYVTDSITESLGWNATYQLERCGGVISLTADHNSTITSPNYPDLYPGDSECEWIVHAASGHFVEAFVDFIFVAPLRNCLEEFLEIRDVNATGAYLQTPFCAKDAAAVGGYRSSRNTMFIRFRGNSTFGRSNRHRFCQYTKCGFKMHFASTKYACGGTISDTSGTVFPPGYPNEIVPHLYCQWDFRTDIQHRYVLEFEFLDKDHVFNIKPPTNIVDLQMLCFMQIEVFSGGLVNRNIQYHLYHRFCANATIFVSTADEATLIYEDDNRIGPSDMLFASPTNMIFNKLRYRPFHVKYTKVKHNFDEWACAYDVTEPQTITIKNMTNDLNFPSSSGLMARFKKNFCHIQIRQPAANSTVRLDFTKFRASSNYFKTCDEMESKVLISDVMGDPYPYNRVLCNGSLNGWDNVSIALLNRKIDVYVLNDPIYHGVDTSVAFTLNISYHMITEEEYGMSGEITSPRFGFDNYTINTDCIWLLQAPEGKIITLEILSMDIEYHIECSNDYLEVSEGHERLAILHRYCNEKGAENEVSERFRRIRSRSHLITLVFHSDKSVTREGFRIAYEFVDPNENGCGFRTHAHTGIIHSPNYPNDYPNDASCIWDVSVPIGFHVRLTFLHMDIVPSRQCHADYLLVSQEHQSRAMAPISSYYFYFDHEESLRRICGPQLPMPVDSESNRMRINFTTDEKTTGKGFQARWEAVCGTVYKMNHGVITSPYYPLAYPNDNFTCEYLIDPETNGAPQIITLKVWDADFGYTPFVPITAEEFCKTMDRLEIHDVTRNTLHTTVCPTDRLGDTSLPPAISIKGPIAIRFIARRTTFFFGKNNRGFKISYALADCGGEINLAEGRSRLSAIISSPGFPLPYHSNLNCVWNITAPAGRIISYKFTNMDLETSGSCHFDYVELFDGAEFPNATEVDNGVRRVCDGTIEDGQRTTNDNRLLVRFVTDTNAQRGGFRMIVTATLGLSSGCGGELEVGADWRTLTPPLANGNKYFSDLRCDWRLKSTAQRKIIELRFTQLDMEMRTEQPTTNVVPDFVPNTVMPTGNSATTTTSELCYDFVTVYDGPKATSPLLMQPSCSPPEDQMMPITFYSSHDSVSVYFESDSYDEFRGFSLDYRAIDNDCGGTFLASAQPMTLHYESERTLTRTNQRHKRCRFYFYATPPQPIEITFTSFSLPSRSADCAEEYAELRDVGSVAECSHPACASAQVAVSSAQIHTCGAVVPPVFISRTSIVQSEHSATFELKYQVLSSCNRTIDLVGNALTGRLTSPNYPNPYSHNETCTTYLTALSSSRIFLVFRDFRLERSRISFPYARISLRSWLVHRDDVFDNQIPDASRLASGFQTTNCVYDSLSIYANSSDPAQNVTYCGFDLPPSIFSTQNKMTLALRSDSSMAYGGYEAFYYTVDAESAETRHVDADRKIIYNLGIIRESAGALTHLPAPPTENILHQNATPPVYPINSLMRVIIIPPMGMNCMMHFREFEMSTNPTQGCGDYLTLTTIGVDASARTVTFNGSDHVRMLCQLEADLKIPLRNAINIMFHADDDPSNDGTGFRMEWSCEPVATVQF